MAPLVSVNAVYLPEHGGYNGLVESRTVGLPPKLTNYGAVALSLLTLVALTVYPLPFCIDCEYPNPWGHVPAKGEVPVSWWLLVAPFLAGAFRLRKGWLVPICVVLALLVTQPLGGVALWSLRENEGPFILLLGLPVTGACFSLGCLVHALVTFLRGAARSVEH